MPELHPAMMEIVPVGATVVTLQFRSRRMGRTRSPWALRAQVSSGPQMLRSHSGNVSLGGEPLGFVLASSSTNCWILRPRATPSSES